MRRAKIVCTLGPQAGTEERIQELIDAGMDVARFNMSHGSQAEHARRLDFVRRGADRNGKAVAALADLQGPKIRLGTFAGGEKQMLSFGQIFTITTDDVEGDNKRCSTTFKGLPGDVKPGDPILIDDGRVALEAVEVTPTDVICRVLVAGPVSDHKGINLPGVAVSVPAMSDKDEDDLRWALRNGFDIIALSFVRRAEDADRVREIMREEGREVPLVAKIEKPQALDNLDEIIDAFDAFMVARGDLGVELPLEAVPMAQKRIINAARKWAKPVIVATQMLESMINAPRPTRAEASDVANAILDGADAVMLSGETSVGQYPVLAVQTMARIVDSAEQDLGQVHHLQWDPHTTGGVIAKAAVDVALGVGAKYLVAFTASGDTPRRLSRLRSSIPILAFTPETDTRQALTLTWGVDCYITPVFTHTDEMVRALEDILLSHGLVQRGERVVIVSGSALNQSGRTNSLRVFKVGMGSRG